jgi:hypothetical protein
MDKPDAIILSHPRSGTHFLLSSLASHPNIHGRGEFILRYRRLRKDRARLAAYVDSQFIFRNEPKKFNVAIVMYGEVGPFENVCGSLFNFKIIHLLRDPKSTAQSLAQCEADRNYLGKSYRAHYHGNEVPHAPAAISPEQIKQFCAKVEAAQDVYSETLKKHPNCMSISYEEITRGREVSSLNPEIATRLLTFLGQELHPLGTSLRKSCEYTESPYSAKPETNRLRKSELRP